MQYKALTSNAITSVGYDPDTRKLHLEFKHGGAVYEYDDVAPEDHQRILDATESHGAAVAAFTKRFKGKRIGK